MNEEIKYYEDCWYKVVYCWDDEFYIKFEATKIKSMDYENIEESILVETPSISGFVRFESSMEIKFDDYFNSFELFFDQFIQVIKHIRAFAKEKDIFFGFDDKYSTI